MSALKHYLILGAAAAALLLAGCNLVLLDPGGSSGSESPDTIPPVTGEVETGLSITVPRFSPWLAETIAEAAPIDGIQAQAIAVADSFTIIVYDSADTEVFNQSYTTTVGSSQTCTVSLDAGMGYSVDLLVYNNDNAYDSGLVVHGSAENIAITNGQTTQISIPCTPVYPIGFTVGTSVSDIALMATRIDASYQVLELGEEFWMIFQAPSSGYARFTPSYPAGVEYVIGVYTQAGEPVKSFMSNAPSTGSVMSDSTLIPGNTYYALFLPMSLTRETVTGSILIEEVTDGDCGYSETGARTVTGVVDISALETAGNTITDVSVQAFFRDSGGVLAGFSTIPSSAFTSSAASYTLFNLDPAQDYDIYAVATSSDDEEFYGEPLLLDAATGDVTGFDYAYVLISATVTVNISYTGSGTVDADHPLYVNLDSADYGGILDTETLTSSTGQVTLSASTLQNELYVDVAYDADGSGWHTGWDPMCFYGETAEDRTPDAIDVSSGTATVDVTFDDSLRFNVDDDTAYPMGLDGTWYSTIDGLGVCVNTFDSGPDFLYTFATIDDTYWETYRIWEWDNESGFFIVQMTDSSDRDNSGLDKYFPSGWSNLTGSGIGATADYFGYGNALGDYFMLDTLEATEAASRDYPVEVFAITASEPLTLDSTRVDVMVNFEYTGTPVTDAEIRALLTYTDGGSVFAGEVYWEGTSGTVTFDDPLVPAGDEVYLQLYYDEDLSFSISEGDPVYRYPTPISVDGGSATVPFDSTATVTSSCPDVAGGWIVSADGTERIITITEDAFAILVPTDADPVPSYQDVLDNGYGAITHIGNGFIIGKWTYPPDGSGYDDKYLKICWADQDGIVVTEIHEAFDAQDDAIASETPSMTFDWSSQLW